MIAFVVLASGVTSSDVSDGATGRLLQRPPGSTVPQVRSFHTPDRPLLRVPTPVPRRHRSSAPLGTTLATSRVR